MTNCYLCNINFCKNNNYALSKFLIIRFETLKGEIMQVQNNMNSPRFTAFKMTPNANDLIINTLKKNAKLEDFVTCNKCFGSLDAFPIQTSITRTHNPYESRDQDKLKAYIEGKIEIEMRKHETISNYLKRLVGIADDLSNDKIKLDMLEMVEPKHLKQKFLQLI